MVKYTTNTVEQESDEIIAFWPEKEQTSTVLKLTEWMTNCMRAKKDNMCLINSKMRYFKEAINDINYYKELLTLEHESVEEINLFDENSFDWLWCGKGRCRTVFKSKVDGYKENKKLYGKILGFLYKKIKSNHSFIIRYIGVSEFKMSSGERAFQNLFSWLDFIPDIMIPKMKTRIFKENILLLIDEADLYMHPQWQKSFVKMLKDTIEYSYNHNRVQVIITTHSPICLSDFPRENCMYIDYDRATNRHIVLPRNLGINDQTFGRDIYALLRNGFFLSGSPMGDFADNYINSLLNSIHELFQEIMYIDILNSNGIDFCKINNKLDECEQRLKIVGNVPLHKKIESMLAEVRMWMRYVSNKHKGQ